ncbi:uncharacterized protein [Emydura macquarii macquarii]|uniref:uncharacterized protein n=1 Tax=Emydura macquarii macquarii TaxID=1129001 RepID=UPI00352BB134
MKGSVFLALLFSFAFCADKALTTTLTAQTTDTITSTASATTTDTITSTASATTTATPTASTTLTTTVPIQTTGKQEEWN